MDFSLSEEAEAVRETARTFADRMLRPRVTEYRRGGPYPHDLSYEMAKAGLTGGIVPEEYGGSGMSYESLVIMVEELSKVDHILAGHAAQASGLLGTGLLRYGTEEQKQRYLVPLCEEGKNGSVAMSEPQGGSDISTVRTRAERKGGSYLLNGQKLFVSHVDEAVFFLTFAQVDPALGRKGITAFIVDRDTKGVDIVPIEEAGGTKPHSWGQVFFDGVELSEEQRLGEEGEGLRVARSALGVGRLVIGARSCGAAHECLEAACAYARDREVFGNRIGRYQMIQKKLADMSTELTAARMLVYLGAKRLDEHGDRVRVDLASAKLFASEMLERTASETIQIFGGYGVSSDYPWMYYLNDAKKFQIAEGTSEIQRMIIAESLLGYRSADVAASGKS